MKILQFTLWLSTMNWKKMRDYDESKKYTCYVNSLSMDITFF